MIGIEAEAEQVLHFLIWHSMTESLGCGREQEVIREDCQNHKTASEALQLHSDGRLPATLCNTFQNTIRICCVASCGC